MHRREFIKVIGGTAVAWSTAAHAQQPMPVIGLLEFVARAEANEAAFRQGLAEAGFVEGRNVTIQRRSANGQYDRLPAMAAELVRNQVSVIAALNILSVIAAKAATATIPIVFEVGSDPVKDGLVASFNRPGGNVTGVTFFANLLTAKRLELLHDIVPGLTTVGLLLNPQNANAAPELSEVETGARALNIRLVVVRAETDTQIDAAMTEFARERATALLVAGDAYLNSKRALILPLAVRSGLATAFADREAVDAGGLVSYGAHRPDLARQCGVYVGRVLKGEKPADLPVVQPTRFEMILNLKTAKALNLTISRELMFRADEVIE